MSERWVIDGSTGWLNARVATISWGAEMRVLGYDGQVAGRGPDSPPVQLRWMLNPQVGLPTRPFTVWKNTDPGGNKPKQELANLPDWEQLEIVGLPVDGRWNATRYTQDPQGLIGDPLPPIEAARRRLDNGAPPMGWTGLTINELALPGWEPPDLDRYLESVLESRLLDGVRSMLEQTPSALEHVNFSDAERAAPNSTFLPRLILNQSAGILGDNESSASAWQPLRLLALSAGSDPYASLALGFGTAFRSFDAENTILMVSVVHQLDPDGPEFELADVVRLANPMRSPEAPTQVSCALVNHTRPQAIDTPSLDTIGVSWTSPLNPAYVAGADPQAPYPASYVIGRFGPEMSRSIILNTPRPEDIRGWLPYVPSRAGGATFRDHLVRSATIGDPPTIIPDAFERTVTYAVAAQDLFGRWSPWTTAAPFETLREAPQAPRLLAVDLDPGGTLTVDLSWDWSDRSPEFVELTGSYADAPANQILAARFDFGGATAPAAPGPPLIPLSQALEPASDWGTPQDTTDDNPGVRYYRSTTTIPIDFAGMPTRDFQVQARGQCHVHEREIHTFNISDWTPPLIGTVYDPTPADPPAPEVKEAPQWASLPDSAGESRFVLRWGAAANAAGYVVYEATETALLSALGAARGPDTSAPWTDRLATLRAANLAGLRNTFRRLQPGLITTTSFEVKLPRGTQVMHLYAVTAVSNNNAESAWPTASMSFVAVAVPHLKVPLAPALAATAETDAGATTARLRVQLSEALPGGRVELFRTVNPALAENVDTMEHPIPIQLAGDTTIEFVDDQFTPGWRPTWYRAIAWSAFHELTGEIEARSIPSAAISLFVPPEAPPTISDLRVNEPGSDNTTSVISWVTDASFQPTPLGTHQVTIDTRGSAGNPLAHLTKPLPELPTDTGLADVAPAPAPGTFAHLATPFHDRIYATLERAPTPGERLTAEITLTDPLGRSTVRSVEIPELLVPIGPPEIDQLDPDNGRPGDTFTIFGRNLIVPEDPRVIVLLQVPTEPDGPPDPGPLQLVGEPLDTRITVVIPPMDREGHFPIVVSRGDGAEVEAPDKLQITLL